MAIYVDSACNDSERSGGETTGGGPKVTFDAHCPARPIGQRVHAAGEGRI
jgi:hypothetical protein